MNQALETAYPRLFALLRRACGFSITEAGNALYAHKFGDGFGSEALNCAGGSGAAIRHALERRRFYRRPL